MLNKLVLATHSSGKIKELTALLAPIECIPQAQLNLAEVEETGLSFIENALLKARHASYQSNCSALGDDSGLVIDALQGRPGIFSARFAGQEASDTANMQKVMAEMQGVPEHARQAYFYCAIALMRYPEDPTPILAVGRLDGMILDEPRGAHGFGYDPIFYVPNYGKTLAELPAIEKNQISHRAQALQKLLQELL